ncbi:Prenyltransferase and squalene oxidase repeat protein [Pseudobythopirellula maris]|uniref:Prenyltransferase and squalene oxidase repeat protein n=1 Tax=Pseudobythopirellula maris TaxID=2527991 RepID=A0A5C5ZSI1_9BACT|nr:prenyltransferase/squalene oxidase repeat-containing protein [Pseudobythopirellula maris]TWT90015.1 Prenyltransferase and squalene oxidase repeat protein [Pseudobythopirellula maris]
MESSPNTTGFFSRAALLALAFVVAACAAPGRAWAIDPEGPEVKELIDKGLKFLETKTDRRLGGKCLIALAFIKAGQPNHARVDEALAACRQEVGKPINRLDVYSNGLALIFLSEARGRGDSNLLGQYLDKLYERQKPHGGWGYHDKQTGDTSQTQYGALGLWEAHQANRRIDPDAAMRMAHWLVATQDPSGTWGYQGAVSESSGRVAQSGVSVTMASAAMGSLLIAADMFGVLNPIYFDSVDSDAVEPLDGDSGGSESAELPSALRPRDAGGAASRQAPPLSSRGLAVARIYQSLEDGANWMENNYKIDADTYDNYYLYALERYKSFEELLNGEDDPEPHWYNDGYQKLLGSVRADGSWSESCGVAVDTAFAVLFLLRSTKKSIRATIGEGALVSGRGLPSDVSKARLSRGQVVAERAAVKLNDFIGMIDRDETPSGYADGGVSLVEGEVDAETADRLAELLRTGSPEARLAAAGLLGRTGDLARAPDLIYALTDPDRRVVLAARDALRMLSRRIGGFGLPNDFNENQRRQAIASWTRWSESVSPGTASAAR